MQSFGDYTLLACLNVEEKHRNLQEQNKDKILEVQNGSDLEKYFKRSLLPSEFVDECNDDVNKSKLSSSISIGKQTVEPKESDFEKYFQDSITASKVNKSEKNLSLTSNTSKKNNILSTKKNRNSRRISNRNINAIVSKKKHPFNIVNIEREDKKLDTQQFWTKHNSFHDNMQTIADNSIAASSAINFTCEKGNSHVILSLPLCTQDQCKLASWGLPPNILQKYATRGLENMFTWQMECLSNHKVLQEKQNFVYTAPTSAGKTLVAEILLIKTVLERKKKVIFILPFVSVVREKMYYFQDLLSSSGIRVEGFMGGTVPCGGFAATHVAIATIEKANSLVNRLMEENELNTLGAVIIDELHLLCDPNRGYLLELLLTKLKYMTIRNDNIDIQLIGMSATLPNLSLLAKWLNAEFYETEFRPIPLNEYCKIGANIYDNKLNLVRKLAILPELETDVDHILQLCIETINAGHSVLIFCSTKKWCEKLAEQIATAFFKLVRKKTTLGEMLKKEINSELICETLEQLKRSPSGLDNILKSTISFGIAFHHAGLTMDERDIIEGSFRMGSLRILIATSTLSSGVNLPARRVIIRSPLFGCNPLNALAYKQMIGRAGRMGKDTAGESILMCKPSERNAAASLLSAMLEPIESCLNDSTLLIRALLEAVASEVLYTSKDLELYINCTLLSLREQSDIQTFSNEAIKFLLENEFLLSQNTAQESRWIATPLGKACLAASVPPREGLFLFEELQKARRCFVLDTELHVIYLVTPLSGSQIGVVDWMIFHELWNTMSESERRVGKLVGVEERFVMSAIKGIVKPGKSLNIHKRFYSALALRDLVNEVPLNTVCKKYGCCRGVLQTLQQSAATYAGMVTQFCKELHWDCMELLVNQFQTRLQFGVCRELLDLLRLPTLNGLRARSLYKQGITCVADLALANELNVERALYNALPFESEKEYEGEYAFEAEKRNKMRTVFVTGRDGLTPRQAAILLVREARMLVQRELGFEQLSWEQNERTLRANTHVEDVASDVKEQSRMESDIQYVKYPMKICQISVTENLIHDKPAIPNNDRRKNADRLNIGIFREIGEKRTTIESNDPSILSLENSDTTDGRTDDGDSLNILLPNSPDVAADDIRSNNFRENQIHSETGGNVKRKRSFGDSRKHGLSISNKQFKVSNSNDNGDSMNKNASAPLLDKNVKLSNVNSNSPSLFDDSLNLDTQMCDILEQNAIDISRINMSELEYSKAFVNKLDTAYTTRKKSVGEIVNIDDVQIHNKNNAKNARAAFADAVLLSAAKSSILSWNDDSWNDSKELFEEILCKNDENIKNEIKNEEISKQKIRDVVNTTSASASVRTTPGRRRTKTYAGAQNNKDLLSKTNAKKRAIMIKEKAPRKSALSRVENAQSPAINVNKCKNERKTSLDSNKFDPDDVIGASQCFESPFCDSNKKNRTRTQLEKIRQKRSRKLADDTRGINYRVNSPTEIFLEEIQNDANETKPKLRLKKISSCARRYSTESVIDDFENEAATATTATDSTKSIAGVMCLKTQSNILNENAKLQIEIVERSDDKKDLLSGTNTDWNTLNIVKVANSRTTFNLFKREVSKKQNIALALHCDMYTVNDKNNIGSKICPDIEGKRSRSKNQKAGNYTYGNKEIRGVAISWDSNIAYYISLHNSQESKVSGKEQMTLLKELLSNTCLYMKCFAIKEKYKLLYRCCGISAKCRFLDPVVAHWLYTNDSERNFSEMVMQYFPQGNFIMKHTNSCYNAGPGLDVENRFPGEFRSAAEAVLTWNMTNNVMSKLEEINPVLLHTFRDIEMKIVTILACMELSGIGVNLESLRELLSNVLIKMQSLETKAYHLAGRKFNLSSSKEVAQILGLYKDKKMLGTSKAVLEKCDNPISPLVVSWRKLSSTKTKIIYPLLNLFENDYRIRGNCITCTITGRISMHEPNLQNVPKDFSFEDDNFFISVRTAFVPALGNIMLSADYCQLELRLLTHFSQDSLLRKIMKQQGDIFINIASEWNNVTEVEVTSEMRQRTKQLCYGMIYGMGVKSLAETLRISESEAQEFLESFMSTYPGIYEWMNDVLEKAHKDEYVTTLLGRRRQLPDLKSTMSAVRAKAERQAVNTKIQGSAADIVKKAMINIDEKMRHNFPDSAMIFPETGCVTRKLRSNSGDLVQRGGFLVLHLHDELLYEINLADLKEVAAIIRESMENVCQLTVPLPIKMKVGPSWSDLTNYQF